MKEVIKIDIPQATDRPVVFTHLLSDEGWTDCNFQPSDYNKVVYLGKCLRDGDMFAAYTNGGHIDIYKGHLNSGRY